MSGRYCSLCGEMDYSDVGDMPCRCNYPEPGPSWTIEGECAHHGHVYDGDEDDPRNAAPDGLPLHEREALIVEAAKTAGRCYCGQVRYPAGGPSWEREET